MATRTERRSAASKIEQPRQISDPLQPAVSLLDQYRAVRRSTEKLCEPLTVEDYVVQSMPDVSPTKWHLAHTTWFFEVLALAVSKEDYRPFDERYYYLFNSYYNTIGPQFCRLHRGNLSRPTVEEIYKYREHVDKQVGELLSHDPIPADLARIVTLGLNHEQQHQELILCDIKHILASNPLRPTYIELPSGPAGTASPLNWNTVPGKVYWVGHEGSCFAYDNETPRHRVFVEEVSVANRLITNGEFLEFMADDGYDRPELWLSDGWSARQLNTWTSPLYWGKNDGDWQVITLGGVRDLNPAEPVCHVSYYEADAYARWKGAWLPREATWEAASVSASVDGNFVESGNYHPVPLKKQAAEREPAQFLGDVWEWTSSPYVAYPGYRAAEGPLGEYNAKFMANQMVLRGGSCATPKAHIRNTYRNFFPPDARWQFSGFRLAREPAS